MMAKMRLLLALCGLQLAGNALAQASLMDKKQLVAALATNSPCCVIDGRPAKSRQRAILDNALPWRANLEIKPTATVIVVADRDQDALQIARVLERKYPGKSILAVKGGLSTWKATTFALLAASVTGEAGGLVSFVIPANTCEHGKPLQELRPDRK